MDVSIIHLRKLFLSPSLPEVAVCPQDPGCNNPVTVSESLVQTSKEQGTKVPGTCCPRPVGPILMAFRKIPESVPKLLDTLESTKGRDLWKARRPHTESFVLLRNKESREGILWF